MRIIDCFETGRPSFSFEYFPPKSVEGWRNLYVTVGELAKLEPSFVSVTYGAGGSTRDLTVDLVGRIKREIGVEAMAHLTCVGHSAGEIAALLDRLRDHGIENVLALRGDPPRGQAQFVRPENGFGYGQELVRFIRERYDFCVAGACYPEGHVDAVDLPMDLAHLKEKVDSGAEFLVTQLFFDPADYFNFVTRARAIGITVPIVPGIMPVTDIGQLEKFRAFGSRIPDELRERVERVRGDEQGVISAGIDWATRQCRQLLEGGAPGLHFYTLNRSLSTRMIYLNLMAG